MYRSRAMRLLVFGLFGLFTLPLYAQSKKEDTAAAKELFKKAEAAYTRDETEEALKDIEAGLLLSPNYLDLLFLRGHVYLKTRDYQEADSAYKAFLEAGAKGSKRREAEELREVLSGILATRLTVTVENGPAKVYLRSRIDGVLCVADPSCTEQVRPGTHKVIIERAGYATVIVDRFEIKKGESRDITKTLTELPSEVEISSTPAGAQVTIDGEAAGVTPIKKKLPAGEHAVEVKLEGRAPSAAKIAAREGKPITHAVTLHELLPLALSVPDAEVFLNGAKAAVYEGALVLPPDSGEALAVTAKAAGYHDAIAEVPKARVPGSVLELRLRPMGGLLSVEGAPDGAAVKIDGTEVAKTPLSAPVEVEPGEHAVEISGAGFLPFRQKAVFKQGAPTVAKITHLRDLGRGKVWVTYGAAGALLATSAGFGALVLSKQTAFNERAGEFGVVSDPESPDFDPQLRELKASGDRLALISDISLGAAIAAAGVGTVFWLKTGRGLSRGEISVAPVLSPSGVGLAARF
jgi:hypothetical protein